MAPVRRLIPEHDVTRMIGPPITHNHATDNDDTHNDDTHNQHCPHSHCRASAGSTMRISDGTHPISVTSAGVLGLEPRMAEPESAVLPITPYPKGIAGAGAGGRVYLPGERTRKSMPLLVFAVPTVLPGRGTIPAGDGSAPRRTRAGSDRGRSSQPG